MTKVLVIILCAAFLQVQIDSAEPSIPENATTVKANDTSQEQQDNNNNVLPSNSTITTTTTTLSTNSTVPSIVTKPTDIEVEDLNKPAPTPESITAPPQKSIESLQITDGVDDDNLPPLESDDDVGLIQTGGNEDDVDVVPLVGAQTLVDDMPIVNTLQGQIPAMVAGIFVIMCFIGYGGMLMWRRYLERKYGNREMLVNEDFYDPSDLRHFSL